MLGGSMLALGFLHGLGADHLMAIVALSVATPLGPARHGRAFWLAVRFAVGHALLLSVGGGLVLFFGWQIPARFEQSGELAGGCLLILLGLLGGWLALDRRSSIGQRRSSADQPSSNRRSTLADRRWPIVAHSHPHLQGDAGLHRHWHLHIGHHHSHRFAAHTALPGVMGAIFAVSGLRALVLSLPLWNSAFGMLLFLVTLFALGILISMSLFGIVLAHLLTARRMAGRMERLAGAATALGSLALGIYWITAL